MVRENAALCTTVSRSLLGWRLVASALCCGIIFPASIIVAISPREAEHVLSSYEFIAEAGDVSIVEDICVSDEPNEEQSVQDKISISPRGLQRSLS